MPAGFSPADYRSYLAFLATHGPFRREAGRLSVSDVIQETMLRAHARRLQFQGATETEYKAWLRQILANVVVSRHRRASAQKRDLARERTLQELAEASSICLDQLLAAVGNSPSHRLIMAEDMQRLIKSVEDLPDTQQTAFRLRYLEQLSITQIASEMSTTKPAIAGLLRRAIAKVRNDLQTSDLSQ